MVANSITLASCHGSLTWGAPGDLRVPCRADKSARRGVGAAGANGDPDDGGVLPMWLPNAPNRRGRAAHSGAEWAVHWFNAYWNPLWAWGVLSSGRAGAGLADRRLSGNVMADGVALHMQASRQRSSCGSEKPATLGLNPACPAGSSSLHAVSRVWTNLNIMCAGPLAGLSASLRD